MTASAAADLTVGARAAVSAENEVGLWPSQSVRTRDSSSAIASVWSIAVATSAEGINTSEIWSLAVPVCWWDRSAASTVEPVWACSSSMFSVICSVYWRVSSARFFASSASASVASCRSSNQVVHVSVE